jgi:hypothetical protein
MRIVQEKVDKENYLELCISPRELELLRDYMIISKKVFLEGEITNVGIKLGLDVESDEDGDGF